MIDRLSNGYKGENESSGEHNKLSEHKVENNYPLSLNCASIIA